MKELLSRIIYSILTGQDYRTYVLATINKRFIDKVEELTAEIFEYKKRGNNWLEKLLEDTSKKEVCLEIGKRNLESLRILLSEIENESPYKIKIIIKKDNEQVELDDLESIIFVNIISAMKLTIQGGAWSEAGKQTEKSLLYVIFRLLNIPEEDYVLLFDQMKKKGLVENREIDAIVFNKDKKPIIIELKLLGIGNPEIGDEALARKVDLFLVDRLTDMMKEESKKFGVKVIEFRKKDSLNELYSFFLSKNVECSKPEKLSSEQLKERIKEIIKDWESEKEELKFLKKIKELTTLK